jgi:hypothetical protein
MVWWLGRDVPVGLAVEVPIGILHGLPGAFSPSHETDTSGEHLYEEPPECTLRNRALPLKKNHHFLVCFAGLQSNILFVANQEVDRCPRFPGSLGR